MALSSRYRYIWDEIEMLRAVKNDQSSLYETPRYTLSRPCSQLGLEYQNFKKLRNKNINITEDELNDLIDQLKQRIPDHIQIIRSVIDGRLIISNNTEDNIKRQCQELGLNYTLFSKIHNLDFNLRTLYSLIEQHDKLYSTEIKEPDTI